MTLRVPKDKSAFRYLNIFRKATALYAIVKSESNPDLTYNIKKSQNILGASYKCSCLDYFYREHDCKHIKRFKQEEALAASLK